MNEELDGPSHNSSSLLLLLPVELILDICTTCINYYNYDTSFDEYYERKTYSINRMEEMSLGLSMRQQFRTYLTFREWARLDCALTNRQLRRIYLTAIEGRMLFSPTVFLSSSSLRWIQQRSLKLASLYLTPYVVKELKHCPIDLRALKMIVIPSHNKDTLFDMLHVLHQIRSSVHFVGFEKNHNVNISLLKKLSRSFAEIRFLSLYSCRHINDICITKLTQYQYGRQIIEINVSKCGISNSGLLSMVHDLSRLKSLDISYCRVSYAAIGKIVQSCSASLIELVIDYLEYPYPTVLQARTELMEIFSLFERFGRNLLLLSIRGNSHLCDDCLGNFINYCRQVKQINLTECFRITNQSLFDLARFSSKLMALDLRDCFELSDDGVISVLKQCPSLQDLAVDGCHRLTPLVLKEIGDRKNTKVNFFATYTQCPKL